MRIALFYSEVESFNCFTDLLAAELHTLGHKTFILDLKNPPMESPHSFAHFSEFCKADNVECQQTDGICCDGGITEAIKSKHWHP